jgi:hypothetical protein
MRDREDVSGVPFWTPGLMAQYARRVLPSLNDEPQA